MNELHFCSYIPQPNNQWMTKPFKFDGKTCATNRHILLIKADGKHYDPIPSKRVEKNLRELAEKIWDCKNYKAMPSVEIPEMTVCNLCEGSGHAVISICKACGGTGELEKNEDCQVCEGYGYIESLDTDEDCPQCHGSGKHHKPRQPIDVLGLHIDARYLHLIIDAHGVQVANLGDDMLGFKGAYYAGAIKGMRV